MLYKKKKLVLDSFRTVLERFTVDIQDVVRSAILDDVDISGYIDSCSSDPYKLDQIRLAMKEGIEEEFFSLSGSLINKIRRANRIMDISPMKDQLSRNISEVHLEYIMKWYEDRIDFSSINVMRVPKSYLDSFDKGLRAGLNMSKYIGLVNKADSKYIDTCIQLETSGIDTSFLCEGKLYDKAVLLHLRKYYALPKSKWALITKYIKPEDSVQRVEYIINIIQNNLSKILPTVCKVSEGVDLYSDEALKVMLTAYRKGLDIEDLLSSSGTSASELGTKMNEKLLNSSRKVGGRIVKKKN